MKSVSVALVLFVGVQPIVAQTATPAKTPNYAARGGHVVQQLADGQYGAVESAFDEQLAKDLPQAKLADLWRQMVHQAGPFKKVTASHVTHEAGGYESVAMTCAFERAPEGDALVAFEKAGRIAGLYFGPQPTDQVSGWMAPRYVDAARFQETAVTVSDGAWHLPGTLTLPKGKGPFPGVVLVPGSPPMDQDSTAGPNKPFKDLAWGLASRGIAVLRYTKRTHQFGAGLGGLFSSFTLEEELNSDARAAVAVLAGRSEIDHRRIYVIGHSMGGVAVTQIAADDSKIAGIAVMGTPSGDLLTVLIRRAEDMASGGGEEGKEASSMIPVLKELRSGTAPGPTVDLFGGRSPVGYWAGVRNYEPGVSAAKLKIPVMVLVGGHDAEVPPDDFESWKRDLAGRGNASIKFYPGLFHLFMPSTATGKGDAPEDWERPSHVTPEVVNDLASWVVSRNGK